MGWVKAIATVLVLWSSTAWSATLAWNASSGPDLAGYRVYQCSQLPCAQSASTATLLVTLGTSTSFNIGTPAVVQYYVVTAYNSANIESSPSNVATFTPAGTSSPTPASTPPPTVTLTVLGSPTSGQPWTVRRIPPTWLGPFQWNIGSTTPLITLRMSPPIVRSTARTTVYIALRN